MSIDILIQELGQSIIGLVNNKVATVRSLIPTKTSELTNDSGFIIAATAIRETAPIYTTYKPILLLKRIYLNFIICKSRWI